jgi:hypothetical protein
MRSNGVIVANAVVIALALACLVAAFVCDWLYRDAHYRTDKAFSEVRRSGADYDSKASGITSPEVYYQRARTVRQWAVYICFLGLLVAGLTRKWQPAAALVVMLLLTMAGGTRL